MKWSLYLGKFAGIKVFIHWTFAILLVWIFIAYYQMGESVEEGLMGVVFILALFACVTLHEFGHALTARRFDIVTKRITLLPIGGLAQMEKMPEKPARELGVALAGPMVNVVIAGILYVYLTTTGNMPDLSNIESIQDAGFWFNLYLANIILVAFNLIPAFPMDGGRAFRALLSFKFDRGKATRVAASIGQFLAIMFVFAGLFYNLWLVFIGIFIYLGAGAEASFEMTKLALADYKVKDVLMKQYTALQPNDTLERAVELLLNGQEQEFIVTEEEKVIGILTRKELIKGLSEFGKQSPVSRAMRKDFMTLKPDAPLQDIYQKMARDGKSVSPVMDNGNLLGIIDKENIDELLMVREALQEN